MGYVGVPLVIGFGNRFNTIRYHVNTDQKEELKVCNDHTLECNIEDLRSVKNLQFTNNQDDFCRQIFL